MRGFKISLAGLVLVFLVLFFWAATVSAQEGKNQCVNCHSELKKLIRLCWEVEKIRPRPPASKENSGEG